MKMVQIQKARNVAPTIDSIALPADKTSLERMAIQLSSEHYDNRYKLGRVLAKLIHESSNGYCGGKYTNFAQFCRKGLGFSYFTARKLIRATSNFTKEQFRSFGVVKCALVSDLAKTPADRRKALEMLQEGKPMREIVRVFAPHRLVSVRIAAKSGYETSLGSLRQAALKLSAADRLKLAQSLFDSVKHSRAA